MYDYNYGYNDYGSTAGILGGFAAVSGIMMLISLAVGLLMLISQWKVYKKAGKGGWECLIPIYNIIVLIQIAELPLWYIALFFVPFANIYAMFKIYIELAHKFGKSTGFGVGLALLNVIFFPILAFGKDNVYKGGNNTNQLNNNQNNVNVSNDTITFGAMPNGESNQMNYNNPNEPQPISFNQNINTQINPIQQPATLETPSQVFNVTPQPEINVVPTTIPQPVENNPVNNINNPINNTVPEPATLEAPSQVSNVTPEPMQQPANNPQPEMNAVPNMAPAQPQVENNPVNNFNDPNNQNM